MREYIAGYYTDKGIKRGLIKIVCAFVRQCIRENN